MKYFTLRDIRKWKLGNWMKNEIITVKCFMIFYSIFIIKFSWNFWINHFELLLSSHSKDYVMPFKNHFGWSLRKSQLIWKTGQNGLKLVRNAFSNGYSSLKIDYIFWSIKLYTLYQTKLYYNLAKVMMSSKIPIISNW